MSYSLSFPLAKALPSVNSAQFKKCPHSSIFSKHTLRTNYKPKKGVRCTVEKPNSCSSLENSGLAIQIGALLATLEQPAFAVTGVNYEEDLTSILIEGGIIAFWYFLIMPPIILNWLRLRWYKRKFVEMYFQFMFVFLFFPGMLLWAPFVNFRRMPRDPSMKYPWSTPQESSATDPKSL